MTDINANGMNRYAPLIRQMCNDKEWISPAHVEPLLDERERLLDALGLIASPNGTEPPGWSREVARRAIGSISQGPTGAKIAAYRDGERERLLALLRDIDNCCVSVFCPGREMQDRIDAALKEPT